MAQAVLFDTHAFIKELKESGFEEKQAEALSGAIRKVQEAHLEELATKRDIKELELKIKEMTYVIDSINPLEYATLDQVKELMDEKIGKR